MKSFKSNQQDLKINFEKRQRFNIKIKQKWFNDYTGIYIYYFSTCYCN